MAKILFVDDRSDVVDPLVELFNKMGDHKAEIAYSAQEAEDKIRAGNFDIVLSDYSMLPGKNGVALAKWIGEEKKGQLPVIILSGTGEAVIQSENPEYARLKSSGVIAAYMPKGILRYKELNEVLNDVLSRPKIEPGTLGPIGGTELH